MIQIEKIEKLEKCFRLKELYLQNNRISCLRGSLSNLRFLTRLSLSGNQLKNLEAALPLLSHMHLLQNLDLFGNPLAEEHNFRLHVIYNIPSLIMLDRLGKRIERVMDLICRNMTESLCSVVTKEEKADAEALYCRLIAEGVVKPLRRAQMVKMKPPLAFGKIFKPILIDEVANSKSKKLSLYHKLVRDTKVLSTIILYLSQYHAYQETNVYRGFGEKGMSANAIVCLHNMGPPTRCLPYFLHAFI